MSSVDRLDGAEWNCDRKLKVRLVVVVVDVVVIERLLGRRGGLLW